MRRQGGLVVPAHAQAADARADRSDVVLLAAVDSARYERVEGVKQRLLGTLGLGQKREIDLVES